MSEKTDFFGNIISRYSKPLASAVGVTLVLAACSGPSKSPGHIKQPKPGCSMELGAAYTSEADFVSALTRYVPDASKRAEQFAAKDTEHQDPLSPSDPNYDHAGNYVIVSDVPKADCTDKPIYGNVVQTVIE